MFFCTFPFNGHFAIHVPTQFDSNAVQRAKFRSFLYYFDWLERSGTSLDGSLRVSRKVMTGKQWLTIEDWLECELPLCDVEIRHEGKLDKADPEMLQTVFASARLGGDVLADGDTQESIQFCTFPELLAVLLYVESLEDNESLQIENVHHVARIVDPRQKGPLLERIAEPKATSLCCIDAENYRALPSQQFEEDDILREGWRGVYRTVYLTVIPLRVRVTRCLVERKFD